MNEAEKRDVWRLDELFPELADMKDELGRILDAAHKEGDGSVTPLQYTQLKSVWKSLCELLLAQLFDAQ